MCACALGAVGAFPSHPKPQVEDETPKGDRGELHFGSRLDVDPIGRKNPDESAPPATHPSPCATLAALLVRASCAAQPGTSADLVEFGLLSPGE